MFEVDATARPVLNRAGVRLRIWGSTTIESRSPADCFEANVGPPPFVECTAVAGTGWDDDRPRKLFLAIDNLAGKPVSANLSIVIMDPLE